MQIAHRAHAALVELVEELNERSSERGPWALTVQPGCNIATVRKCMMMIKHGPRDREFIEAVVERGNELVRPIDLARMMRSGEEWASEDHGVIFYRLVRVLNGARAIAPDETEFGRRDDVARDVQQAMTHAAELGFVVLHEGKAYTDHMHEITIPNGSRFGASRHLPEIKKANKPSFGTKGHKRDMVRKIEISEVENGTKTKEKVCCPVFVSGDTRFLVRCIGTMRNTETPVQVEGVHLTERLVCKHVALYHPASWPRWKQDQCAGDSKNKEGGGHVERSRKSDIEDGKEDGASMHVKSMGESVAKWKEASTTFIADAKALVNSWDNIIADIQSHVMALKTNVVVKWKNITQENIERETKTHIDETELKISQFKGRISDMKSDKKNTDLVASHIEALRATIEIVDNHRTNIYETESNYLASLKEIQHGVQLRAREADSALKILVNLSNECTELRKVYLRKALGERSFTKKTWSITMEEIDKWGKRIGSFYKPAPRRSDASLLPGTSYTKALDNLNKQLNERITKAEGQPKQKLDAVNATAKEEEQAKEKEPEEGQKEAEPQEEAPLDDPWISALFTQVPQDADMCVAVQVSGELFRIVHLTRDVETQRETKAKREEGEEEAKKAKKTKRAQKEEKAEKAEKAEEGEIKKYDDAGYAKKMKEDKDGNYKGDKDAEVERLTADYDDYRECVSAAKKYLDETCIVNDTTESWSSAAWRLTKECREEASGTSGTSGTANFGHLEASDRLELVLVPRNLFGHVYGKESEPTYEGKAEISKDGIWIYEANGRGKVCPKCAVCEKSEHDGKKNKSGLFVLYNKSDKDRIRGLSSRFCFHQPV